MSLKKYKLIKDGAVENTIIVNGTLDSTPEGYDSVEEVLEQISTTVEAFRYQALDPLFLTSHEDILSTFANAIEKASFVNSNDATTVAIIEDYKSGPKERQYTLSTFEALNAAGTYSDAALVKLQEKLDADTLISQHFSNLGYISHEADPDDAEQVLVTLQVVETA